MRIGIIGLPSSGKSTLFSLLTGEREPPDFSLGNKPRLRTVKLEDARLERLRDDYQPRKYTPASFELLDFPGVQLENVDRSGLADILAPARELDALIVSLGGFRAAAESFAKVIASDWDEVLGELVLSDLDVVERRLEKLADKSRRPNFSDDDRREQQLLGRSRGLLEAERPLTELELGAEDRKRLLGFGFLSAKPRVFVLNLESGPAPQDVVESLRAVCGGEVLAVCALSELEISELPPEEREVFLAEYGIDEPQAANVIAAAYRVAERMSYFTAGEKEVRAWTVRVGAKAPEAAGAVHTDFERGFIRAEVVSYADYVADGGLKGAREKGHLRVEGREYVVQDGDIIEFRFAV